MICCLLPASDIVYKNSYNSAVFSKIFNKLEYNKYPNTNILFSIIIIKLDNDNNLIQSWIF